MEPTSRNGRAGSGGVASATRPGSSSSRLNDLRGCVWHDEIVGIEAKKAALLTGATLILHTARGPIDIARLIDPCPEIETFYRALLQIPAGQRGEPGHPPLTASEHDPIGAHAARSGLWYADERTLSLLTTLEQGAADGRLDPATATDLVARVLLAHRSGVCTPAGHGESHMSPLAAVDLGAVLTSLFGAPLGYQSPQPGTHWLDVRIDPSSPQTSAALKALGIASFFALGIGFSPGRMIAAEMMAKPKLGAIRFVYADVAGGCAYEMYAHGRRLEHGEGELAHAIHLALREAAWPVLARRAVVGWQGEAA